MKRGFYCVMTPDSYSTNEKIRKDQWSIHLDLLLSFEDEEMFFGHIDAFYNCLASQVSFAAQTYQEEYFLDLLQVVIAILQRDKGVIDISSAPHRDAIDILGVNVISACKHLKVDIPSFLSEKFGHFQIDNYKAP